MTTLPADYLPDVVKDIKAALARIDAAGRTAVTEAVNAGLLLVQAKSRIPHGAWLPWLSANFDLSDRTARLYMQLARSAPQIDMTKSATVADLTIQGAVKLIAQPRNAEPVQESRTETPKRTTGAEVAQPTPTRDDFDPWHEREVQDAVPNCPAMPLRKETREEHAWLLMIDNVVHYLHGFTDGSAEAMHEKMDELAKAVRARINEDWAG